MAEVLLCHDEAALREDLRQMGVKNILLIGPRTLWQLRSYLQDNPRAKVEYASVEEFHQGYERGRSYDCILVAEVIESMAKPYARLLLDALCESADHVLLRAQLGMSWLRQISYWEPQDLRSKGFDLAGLVAEFGRPVGLFRYNANAYKHHAQWLNSNYWAQPD